MNYHAVYNPVTKSLTIFQNGKPIFGFIGKIAERKLSKIKENKSVRIIYKTSAASTNVSKKLKS